MFENRVCYRINKSIYYLIEWNGIVSIIEHDVLEWNATSVEYRLTELYVIE